MSFYIRKSVKFGPIRFNISKSGIGVSAGVTGARIATGPRGTYIHLGRNGIYYRQKIDGSISNNEPATPKTSNQSLYDNSAKIDNLNIDNLIESDNKDTINQINSRIQQTTFAWLIGILITLFAGVLFLIATSVVNNASSFLGSAYPVFSLLSFIAVIGIWATGIWVAWVTHQQENLARTTTLKYKLEEDSKAKFITVQNSFDLLSKSASIWRLTSRMATDDWKRNAGATSLIKRKRIRVGYMRPPFIHTRIKVYGLQLDSIQLFFLPDLILVFQSGKYSAINYTSLIVRFSTTRYIEEESVPSDSQIIDYTWRYVRKDGGPDRRFSNNRQIPITNYGYIELTSQTGLELHLQVSNLSYAQQFTNAILDYMRHTEMLKTAPPQGHKEQDYKKEYEPNENAYAVLNVPKDASWEDISTSYKKLAQMYHPDKVAGLAHDYQELAEMKMKLINAAYEQIKRNFGK
ncbi:MAG: DUF4236 domain-containing protein [bacterium]|nr:DUF4236 domain-containing protein [bacterium]